MPWRWLNTSLPLGSGEWIPCSALLVPAAFALPGKLSASQPTSFLTFGLPIHSLSCPWVGVSERLLGICCQLGLSHDNNSQTTEYYLICLLLRNCFMLAYALKMSLTSNFWISQLLSAHSIFVTRIRPLFISGFWQHDVYRGEIRITSEFTSQKLRCCFVCEF